MDTPAHENAPEAKVGPSEYYKQARPEYFSDSEKEYEVMLPREMLGFELNRITTNQKQDLFETLCRRIAERTIAPNLIPQVGPTGGGDGKIDSETYTVAEDISDRWFIPENGWNKEERWAFAISAKEDWAPKLRNDVKKIVDTKRGYTRIYFMTNQTPSSKKKKELEDELKASHNIAVTILDSEWLLEKIYGNDLIELVVETLNLSSSFRSTKQRIGAKDSERIEQLNLIEANLENPNRYAEYDFQIVEDALQAAILSRMLERPRLEVDGKFDRAMRFGLKVKNKRQLSRIHYQRAWTYLFWFDDYKSFAEQYNAFKNYISDESPISEIKLWYNLYSSAHTVQMTGHFDFKSEELDLAIEESELLSFLDEHSRDSSKPSASLTAQSFKSMLRLTSKMSKGEGVKQEIFDLSEQIRESPGRIEYPFDIFKDVLEKLGECFPNSVEYDKLFDDLAKVSEKRSSERAAGEIFWKRGRQKFIAGYSKESIIFFGKSIAKLSKEESLDLMCYALRAMADAYSALDLIYAANSSLVVACSIYLKSWFQKGIVEPKAYHCVVSLLKNELRLGRMPFILSYYELYCVLSRFIDRDGLVEEEFDHAKFDACIAIRTLRSHDITSMQRLPTIFRKQGLTISADAALYMLGHYEDIVKEMAAAQINDIDLFYDRLVAQPFSLQFLQPTNYLTGSIITLDSTILGCHFQIICSNDQSMIFAAEAIMALLEKFFSTLLDGVLPLNEKIEIRLHKDTAEQKIRFEPRRQFSTQFDIHLNELKFRQEITGEIWATLRELVSTIAGGNFVFSDMEKQVRNLLVNEEVFDRMIYILEHHKFSENLMGVNPKLLIDDWINEGDSVFSYVRKEWRQFDLGIIDEVERPFASPEETPHSRRQVISIFDNVLWDSAHWVAFGSFDNGYAKGFFLGFVDGGKGNEIFDSWIAQYGQNESDEFIHISIIRGINREYPHWYRIVISPHINIEGKRSGAMLYAQVRMHEMHAETPETMQNIIAIIEDKRPFLLCPAHCNIDKMQVVPDFERVMVRKSLNIKFAWEISENDIEALGIRADDQPFIPDGIENPPVLQVIATKRKL